MPSEYGIRKMREEARYGPVPLLQADAAPPPAGQQQKQQQQQLQSQSAARDAVPGKGDGKKKRPGASSTSAVVITGRHPSAPRGEGGGAASGSSATPSFDPERLRAWELNKLKYFFALVECDAGVAAAALYDACDGLEFESSANVLDLRLVPNDTVFPAHARAYSCLAAACACSASAPLSLPLLAFIHSP